MKDASKRQRVFFVRHGVRLRTGGLTKAWLRRIRLFSAAGWDVHVALIKPDEDIDHTLRVLRADGRLPSAVVVHQYRRDGGSGTGFARLTRRRRVPPSVPGWLDGLAGPDGALVFADSPAAYGHLAEMANPAVARAFVIHLAHLKAAAHRQVSPADVANGPLTLRFAGLAEGTLRAADRIVVPTEAQREDLQIRWGADLPVTVIPHAADPAPQRGATDYDPRLVVVMGRLAPGKRVDESIRVMARVVDEVPDARLVIYGQGEERAALQAVVDEVGMMEKVTFAGYTTTPHAAMAAAACVLTTSRREAMPLTLLESLSVGTPVVTYDIPYGPREIVRDGVDGFVVPARDVGGVEAAVIRILTEPDLRERMSQEARTITARFDPAKHDEAWIRLGRDLYDSRR